jgi:hypothetical protein
MQVKPSNDVEIFTKIRQLKYSPDVNPLVEPQSVQVKKKWVKASQAKDLINSDTGEVEAVSAIHQIQEVDDAQFVKLFAAGVKAMYELSPAATKVFTVVLGLYEKEPMHNGFADCLALSWVNGGLLGVQVGLSESTFNRGLRELVARRFLSARLPCVYWVNPALICKGNRVMLVNEFRRKKQSASERAREKLEANGQQRLPINLDPSDVAY